MGTYIDQYKLKWGSASISKGIEPDLIQLLFPLLPS